MRQSVLVLHLALLLLEDFPALLILLGLFSHATYFTLLRTFPFIYVTDVKFIASCVLAVASHVLWFRHFTNTDVFYPFSEILAFFLFCVWLIPFGFFGENVATPAPRTEALTLFFCFLPVSLSANESALPQSGDGSLDGRVKARKHARRRYRQIWLTCIFQLSASQGSLLAAEHASTSKSSHSLVRRAFDSVAGLLSAVVPERFSTSADRKTF